MSNFHSGRQPAGMYSCFSYVTGLPALPLNRLLFLHSHRTISSQPVSLSYTDPSSPNISHPFLPFTQPLIQSHVCSHVWLNQRLRGRRMECCREYCLVLMISGVVYLKGETPPGCVLNQQQLAALSRHMMVIFHCRVLKRECDRERKSGGRGQTKEREGGKKTSVTPKWNFFHH